MFILPHALCISLSTPALLSFFVAQIKGVLNSSQQLAISFERQQASSSGGDQGGGGSGSGSGAGQASPSLGFAYRRTPRSNAYIQPRGFGGGGGVAGSAKKGGKGSGAPVPSSSRLLSEGALTPSAKSGILSPDAYLSGGVKRLNIPTDTEERRQRFSSSRPMIRGAAAAATPNPTDGRRSQPDAGGISNGSGVEEVKGEAAPTGSAVAAAAVTGTSETNGGLPISNGNNRVEFAAASPDGSARRNTSGGASPPPSTGGIGTDVRAAATGADESLLDASPAAAGGSNGGRLFQGESGGSGGGGGASSFTPRLNLEEYDTEPPMAELTAMTEKSLRAVSGFVVSRQGYGSIAWKEPVDLRGVDIGSAVRAD